MLIFKISMPSTNPHSALELIPIHPSQIEDAIKVLDLIDPYHPTPTTTTKTTSIHPPSKSRLPAFDKPSSTAAPRTSTPALEALRSRANRSRRSKRITKLTKNSTLIPSSSSSSSPSPSPSSSSSPFHPRDPSVHPNSRPEFLDRLRSFKLSTYPAGKPIALSPPSMTAFGWSNVSEKNRLSCQTCRATWVLATPSKDDWDSVGGKKLAELGRQMRIEQHRTSCPWRKRRCPSSVYHIPRWKSARDTVVALLEIATHIDCSFFSNGQPTFQLEHPLSDQAVKTLSIVLQSQTHSSNSPNPSRRCLTVEALILVLFGWTAKPLQDNSLKPSGLAIGNLTSQGTGIARLTSDSVDRSSSPGRNPGLESIDELTSSLYCELCHRQALPSKTTTKNFNPIKEHREYCPFVDQARGFEGADSKSIDSLAGWQVHLQIFEKFIERLHPHSHSSDDQDPHSQSTCITLESIAQHFHPPSYSSFTGPTSTAAGSFDDDHSTFSSISPQIKLLNFVKEVLHVSSPSSTRSDLQTVH